MPISVLAVRRTIMKAPSKQFPTVAMLSEVSSTLLTSPQLALEICDQDNIVSRELRKW